MVPVELSFTVGGEEKGKVKEEDGKVAVLETPEGRATAVSAEVRRISWGRPRGKSWQRLIAFFPCKGKKGGMKRKENQFSREDPLQTEESYPTGEGELVIKAKYIKEIGE